MQTIVKSAIGILLAIVAVLTWQLTIKNRTNGQQRKQIEGLTSQLLNKPKIEDLQLQEKCALQAEKVFRALGYKGIQQNGDTDTYQTHYNQKLGKCFMAIESLNMTTASGTTTRFLLDAFEQRGYAEYVWMPRGDKKYWEVPPMVCKLIPTQVSEQACKSGEEYKMFVSHYME